MAIWDGGFHDAPEDEREGEWEDSDDLEDDDAPWRGELHLGEDGWRYAQPGPEEQMYRDIMDEDDEEGS